MTDTKIKCDREGCKSKGKYAYCILDVPEGDRYHHTKCMFYAKPVEPKEELTERGNGN